MRKDIIESNPAILFKRVEEAILEGYRVVDGKTILQTYPIYEIELFEEDVDFTQITDYDCLPTMVIEQYNSTAFLLDIQQAVLSGWKLNLQSLYYDVTGTKRIKAFKEDHLANVKYTKEELTEMSYEDLKEVGKIRGCFVKSRDVMSTKILQYQESEGK